jgi:hypothetical protein
LTALDFEIKILQIEGNKHDFSQTCRSAGVSKIIRAGIKM